MKLEHPIIGQEVAVWAEEERNKLSFHRKPNQDIEAIQCLARERWFLLRLKSKYAAGQSIATRLSRRITVVSKQLRAKIEEYNSKQPPASKITWESVTQLNAEHQGSIPQSIRYQAVRLYHSTARADEEISKIFADMRNTIQHYMHKMDMITAAMQRIREVENPNLFQRGSYFLLTVKKRECELDFTHLSTFLKHGDFPELSQLLDSITVTTPINAVRFLHPTLSCDQAPSPKEASHSEHSNSALVDLPIDADNYEQTAYDIVSSDSEDSLELDECYNEEDEGSVTTNREVADFQFESQDICQASDTSSSGEDEMEVQDWRKDRFLREEFLHKTVKPVEPNKAELCLLREMSDTSKIGAVGCQDELTVCKDVATKSSSSSSSFIRRPPSELRIIGNILRKNISSIRANESLSKGPHFIPKK